MGKPHPMELRQRVVTHVDAGNTHHSAAARFDVSVKFVNDMVRLKRETGSLAPKRQGNPGIGELTPHEDWVRAQVADKGEVTLRVSVMIKGFCASIFDRLSRARLRVRGAFS